MTQALNIPKRGLLSLPRLNTLLGRLRREPTTSRPVRKPIPWRSDGVLPPYVDGSDSLARRLQRVALAIGLALFCTVYGMAFGLFGVAVPLLFIIPPVALAALCLWALPETKTAPTGALGPMLLVTTAAVSIWPNYLALTIPGVPWITAARLLEAPMVFILLYCTSTFAPFRRRLADILALEPWILRLMLAFIIIQLVTLPFSHHLGRSIQGVVNQQIAWTAVFFIAAYVFSLRSWATRWAFIIIFISIIQGFISLWEHHERHVLWAYSIPSFLSVQDPSVKLLLTPFYRNGSAYRSIGTFNTAITLGEFLVLCFNFSFYLAIEGRTIWTRLLGRLSTPFLLLSAAASGSRSSFVGFGLSIGLYGLYFAVRWWRRHPRGLIAPLVVLAYPVAGIAVVASIFFVYRLRSMILGTSGANAESTQARSEQWSLAIPKILTHPWGYGAGESGEVVGWHNPGSTFLSLDVYYVSLLIDYGVIGVLVWVTLFLLTGGKAYYDAIFRQTADWEETLLAPAGISLFCFLVIKLVFAEVDNHILFFSVLGMICALRWRTRGERAAVETAPHRERPTRLAARGVPV